MVHFIEMSSRNPKWRKHQSKGLLKIQVAGSSRVQAWGQVQLHLNVKSEGYLPVLQTSARVWVVTEEASWQRNQLRLQKNLMLTKTNIQSYLSFSMCEGLQREASSRNPNQDGHREQTGQNEAKISKLVSLKSPEQLKRHSWMTQLRRESHRDALRGCRPGNSPLLHVRLTYADQILQTAVSFGQIRWN